LYAPAQRVVASLCLKHADAPRLERVAQDPVWVAPCPVCEDRERATLRLDDASVRQRRYGQILARVRDQSPVRRDAEPATVRPDRMGEGGASFEGDEPEVPLVSYEQRRRSARKMNREW